MNIFEEQAGKICTRGITLSKQEIKNLRIKEIYNSITNIDFQDMHQA
jgi:3'-phosphoadenosine 5'-phosphosulfate sulfotransferase